MEKETDINVEFHGNYIPLQGVDIIVKAAKLLEKDGGFSFTLIGSGQTYSSVRRLAKELDVRSIKFISRIPYAQIAEYIERADICLGIFGETRKTQNVIPNKVYECAAMGKAIISADTPAIREVFARGENILTVPAGNPSALAEELLSVQKDGEKRHRVGAGARAVFRKMATPGVVGQQLLSDLRLRGMTVS